MSNYTVSTTTLYRQQHTDDEEEIARLLQPSDGMDEDLGCQHIRCRLNDDDDDDDLNGKQDAQVPKQQDAQRIGRQRALLYYGALALATILIGLAVGLIGIPDMDLTRVTKGGQNIDLLPSCATTTPPQQPLLECESKFTSNTSWVEHIKAVGQWPGRQRCAAQMIGTECRCRDPLQPATHTGPGWPEGKWEFAFKRNLQRIQREKLANRTLDVVLVGDSITEHWWGTDLGKPNKKYAGNRAVYEELFDKTKGAPIQGLALGIGGDRCRNLLYRLQHGEMDPSLQPAVWWVLIGTNNHGGERCGYRVITVGILRVVQEILARSSGSGATVVINSILPRGGYNRTLREFWGWRALSRVNDRLSCYANGTDRVEFFNATQYFLTADKMHLNKTLVHDTLHPSAEGSRKWGRAIVDKVIDIKRRTGQS